mmetsp:Transcript_36852/g.41165  ORF Transcript_36852/g.41165 Transcript_36852/m.41165 type:complete len:325 (+) Transcript_36852:206-1180(+)
MIRYHLRSSNIKWEGKHINGHQDNGIKFGDLSVEAQANVIADKKAKEELRRGEIPIENNNTEGQPWHIKCKGQTITGSAEERLRHTMQVEESKKWWTGTLVPPDQADASIQWEVYAGFRKLTPRWRHTWSVKYGAGILPTRRNMKIRKHCDDQSCPCCGADVEDTSHLFQCENEEIQKTYEEELDIVKNYLSTTTSITIKNLVVNMLNHLRNGTAPEITEDSEEDRIIFYQLQLGQRATLNGLWLQSWMDLQDTFLKRIRSRKSPKVWLIRLLLLLLVRLIKNDMKNWTKILQKFIGIDPISNCCLPAMKPFSKEDRQKLRDTE